MLSSYRTGRDPGRPDLAALGATIYGVSTQTTEYQREVAARLHLPYEILSDVQVANLVLIRRLTLVAQGGRIRKVFYPVFPPDADAGRVHDWLKA